jgi:hypothetical protein
MSRRAGQKCAFALLSSHDEKSVKYSQRYTGPGHSIIERVLFSAS